MARSVKITYTKSIEDSVLKIALELQDKGLTEGPLNNTPFKEWNVYIDTAPTTCVYKFHINKNSPFLSGKTIYVGFNGPII